MLGESQSMQASQNVKIVVKYVSDVWLHKAIYSWCNYLILGESQSIFTASNIMVTKPA